jgi:hypothetical protein
MMPPVILKRSNLMHERMINVKGGREIKFNIIPLNLSNNSLEADHVSKETSPRKLNDGLIT